jgi:hypothetical protein
MGAGGPSTYCCSGRLFQVFCRAYALRGGPVSFNSAYSVNRRNRPHGGELVRGCLRFMTFDNRASRLTYMLPARIQYQFQGFRLLFRILPCEALPALTNPTPSHSFALGNMRMLSRQSRGTSRFHGNGIRYGEHECGAIAIIVARVCGCTGHMSLHPRNRSFLL